MIKLFRKILCLLGIHKYNYYGVIVTEDTKTPSDIKYQCIYCKKDITIRDLIDDYFKKGIKKWLK